MDMQTVCSSSPSHMRLKSYSIRDFHKHTNLAIYALMLILYCPVVALYLQHKMLVNVKVDVSG